MEGIYASTLGICFISFAVAGLANPVCRLMTNATRDSAFASATAKTEPNTDSVSVLGACENWRHAAPEPKTDSVSVLGACENWQHAAPEPKDGQRFRAWSLRELVACGARAQDGQRFRAWSLRESCFVS